MGSSAGEDKRHFDENLYNELDDFEIKYVFDHKQQFLTVLSANSPIV